MIKKLVLLLIVLWEAFRAVGLFFSAVALLNPTYRTETTLLMGWLFSGSLTVLATEALLLFRGPVAQGGRILPGIAALGKFVTLLPGIMLFLLLSGVGPQQDQAPLLLFPFRNIIALVSFVDLLCIGFLLLLLKDGPGKSRPDSDYRFTVVEEE